jgi:uncharacterized membrane protein YphA (DoxX/SURF4 family)
MKYLVEIPRVLLGLVLVASGIFGLLNMIPHQELQGGAAAYMTGLTGTYLFTLVKLTEVTTGLLLLANRFVPLALVVLAPVMINIVGYHAFYDLKGVAVPVVLMGLQLFVAWRNRGSFAALLTAKPTAATA